MKRAPSKISPKMRRLVDRALTLHSARRTTIFMPTNGNWSEANKADASLTRRANEAKRKLLDEIATLERLLEANRTERRRLLQR